MNANQIMVQKNSLDGEEYEQELVERGLFVCPHCHHAYMKDAGCSNCHADVPPDEEIAAQWSAPYRFEMQQR